MDRTTTSQKEAGSASTLFSTVLVARHQNVRPSALELALRSNCQRLRVVENLSGAHLLLPSGDISLAVRTYNSEDCQKKTTVRHELQPAALDDGGEMNGLDDVMQSLVEWHQGLGLTEDIDGLSAFRNSFKYSLVIIVLEEEEQIRQLSQVNSFFHQVQAIMNGSSAEREESGGQDKMARVVIVPDISSALSVLSSIVDALKPAKRARKEQYFCQQRQKWFLPSLLDHDDPNNPMMDPSSNAAAATAAANAFRELAIAKQLPEGEENVLMSLLGTLKAIVTADDRALENCPIDDRSRYILQPFFGSTQERHQQQQRLVASGTREARLPINHIDGSNPYLLQVPPPQHPSTARRQRPSMSDGRRFFSSVTPPQPSSTYDLGWSETAQPFHASAAVAPRRRGDNNARVAGGRWH